MECAAQDERSFANTDGTNPSQDDHNVLIGTLELPDEALLAEKQMRRNSARVMKIKCLEEAARRSFLILAQPQPSASGPARFDLRTVFRTLGATGEEPEEILPTASLRQALGVVFADISGDGGQSRRACVSDLERITGTAVAAEEIATSIVSGAMAGNRAKATVPLTAGLNFRRFEDWMMPPRGLQELREVLAELVDDGCALGLTVADLFMQITRTGGSCSGINVDASDTDDAARMRSGIGTRQLQEGLGALSVYVTHSEAERLMKAAGCSAGGSGGGSHDDDGVYGLLSFSMFSALVKSQLAHGHRQQNQPGPPSTTADATDDDGANSPDSLAAATPGTRVRLTELEDGEAARAAGPKTGSSSAAAHVEAFGRVAANVQAVLVSAVVSTNDVAGNEKIIEPGRATGAGQGGSFLPGADNRLTLMPAVTAIVEEATGVEDMAIRVPSTRWSPDERPGPIPRIRPISPPLGHARLPFAPLHPTRASRERLKAALDTLGLKERLKPTSEDDKLARNSSQLKAERTAARGVEGEELAMEGSVRAGNDYNLQSVFDRSGLGISPAAITDINVRSSRASIVGGGGGGGRGGSVGRGRKSIRARGVNYHGINRISVARARVRRDGHLDEDEGDGLGPGDADGLRCTPREATKMIGRLRARVAELELLEQLLLCKLEGARADLVDTGKRAVAAAATAAEDAKDRERALYARMSTRLRAAEAEVTAISKRMVEQKRSAVAESIAREKSLAEYLRRRLKEAEVALEAKAARRATADRQNSTVRPEGWGASGADIGKGARRLSNGNKSRLTRAESERIEASTSMGKENNKLREELDACHKKLATATAEALRLRRKSIAEVRKVERKEEGLEEDDERLITRKGKRIAMPCMCGAWDQSCRPPTAVITPREAQQRNRELMLEARLARSEDARIDLEAEASRLQGFLDEMRGLGPLPHVFPGAAAE